MKQSESTDLLRQSAAESRSAADARLDAEPESAAFGTSAIRISADGSRFPKALYLLRTAGLLLLTIVLLFLLQRLLMPKYMGKVVEGSFTEEYYERPMDHDVLILGDCEVYENISPVTLWREYGISSYIRGNAQQLLPQSYAMLEEALSYETPQAVILSVSAMQQYDQENEAYNRMTLDGMRWSVSKWNAIRKTALEDEHMIEYIFPLLRFHSRFSELEADDLRYFWKKARVSYNGYYLRADVRPLGDLPSDRRPRSYAFDDRSWTCLDRIRELCEAHGIRLILMKAPSLYPAWYDQWDEQITAYAEQYGLEYVNCIAAADAIGIDYETDTYDGGLHMNVSGAEKMSRYFGQLLSEEMSVPDRRGSSAELDAWWEAVCENYDAEKAAQSEEFARLGYLSRYQ